jgi:hypothetical protein
MINVLSDLPKPLGLPLVMGAELLGVGLFKLLLDKGRALTASQPAVQARITEMLGNILQDEIGHLAYARLKLGPVGILAARVGVDGVMIGLSGQNPEFWRLFDYGQLAAQVNGIDVAALAAWCPETPYWTVPIDREAAVA